MRQFFSFAFLSAISYLCHRVFDKSKWNTKDTAFKVDKSLPRLLPYAVCQIVRFDWNFWCQKVQSTPRAKTAVNSRPKSGKQHQSKTAISTFCDPTASGNLRDRGGARASVSAKSVAIFRSRTRFATFGLVVPGKIVTFESYLFKPIERCSNACSRLRPSSIKRG